MIDYLISKPDKIINPLLEHIELVLITLLFSLILAALLTLVAVLSSAAGYVLNQLFAILYSIPSLALFALLIPVTGLGRNTAVLVLVIYNQYLLLRNFTTGLEEVDPAIREAAVGIGMTKIQVLMRVQIPLAKKTLFTGIRLAIVSTIGIGTIAASINAGGLGTLLFDGLRTMNIVKILWGSILSAALAIAANGLLKMVENYSDRVVRDR
ncbi:MAG: ABC transporter permease [Eubacteriales bacterium]|nr:ABC transporter permease [Eubacteriales bacterium]